ncbi:MAG: cob(I)yrinic acid a,c-diamide adenosyltransferase [Dysgonamonadaceae bacterium]|jgi:cob(I)alamin adenosyltransferase|nr:cob(I)yrinic acid a,c-diamide adenosyltransferase [Dysgonamonadaceae bacterium]
MKIYTKTGDKGYTSLAGGERVPKTHARLEAYGTIDELNAFCGLLLEEMKDAHSREILDKVQRLLFSVGGLLSTPPEKTQIARHFLLTPADLLMLENEIDRMNDSLPKPTSFILPGGCKSTALAHVCRTIARRAERNIYRIDDHETIHPDTLKFINRLSDYFFVLARSECHTHGKKEKSW